MAIYTNDFVVTRWDGHVVRIVYVKGRAYMVLEDICRVLRFKDDDYLRAMSVVDYQEIFDVKYYGRLLCVDTRGIVWATSKSKKLEIQKFQAWALEEIERAHVFFHNRLFTSELPRINKETEKQKEKEETTNAE